MAPSKIHKIIGILLLALFVLLFINRPTVVTIDRAVIGQRDVVIASYHVWSYEFHFAHGSNGSGWTKADTSIVSNSDVFTPPRLPYSKNPGIWYDIRVRLTPYVAPDLPQDINSTDYYAYEKDDGHYSPANYVRQNVVFEFSKVLVQPENEESFKQRMDYLGDVFSWAEETSYEINGDSVEFTTPGILVERMRPEMRHLCRFWKPEYHPEAWPDDRDEMSVLCQGFLGVRKYKELTD